jgi:hypothetical protein
MGVGATHTAERVAASLGLLNAAQVEFRLAADVPNGGVLLGLPALLAVGMLRHTQKHFELPPGYYGLESVLLLLGFMALARVKSVEALRYCPPGEWGKLLGLDRIPEVRTLRGKIKHLTRTDAPTKWSADLCADWMSADQAALFYVDGHVRVYHGDNATLPRHYVARQKLCLRASADYWVNALGGQPFFVLHQDVDPHLVQVLQGQIVPRLLAEVPHQPSPEQLEKSPLLHRFTVVFDREGYSPQLLAGLKQQRVACLTYHKQPGEDWSPDEFQSHQVRLVSGEQVEMRLAERGVFLAGKVWLREIRRLNQSGQQTSILSTDYLTDSASLAAAMFARWSQENFFRYMRAEYGLDRLIEYGVENIPDDTRVVNPEHRRLDAEIRKTAQVLTRRRAEFQATGLDQATDDRQMAQFQQKKGELLEEIARLEAHQAQLKGQRKKTRKHITVTELPPGERFNRLSRQSKHFIDTVKMVAYRAETAMVNLLREFMSRTDDARNLVRSIFKNEADLIPDAETKILTVRLHHPASRAAAKAIEHLCRELNETETIFPGTDLRMAFELARGQNPGDQEV